MSEVNLPPLPTPARAVEARDRLAALFAEGGDPFGVAAFLRRCEIYFATADFEQAEEMLATPKVPKLPRPTAPADRLPFRPTWHGFGSADEYEPIYAEFQQSDGATGLILASANGLMGAGGREGSWTRGEYRPGPSILLYPPDEADGKRKKGRAPAFQNRLTWWIIDNPDLMEKRPRDLRSKAEIRQRNKSRPDRPRTVTIVDLRAAHREAAADVAAAERTYRSRWIVRGHWHRFWTGPRDGERKLETRYVMPYVKGPAGAPLNVTERVKKW